MVYLPVKYQGQPLMPMKASRIRRFVKAGKARIKYDRKLKQYWVQLLVEPSNRYTQEVTLGIDPGSVFDGFSVVAGQKHLINVELIQKPKFKYNKETKEPDTHPKSVSAAASRRAGHRRVRRGRLRHRKARFESRTSSKMSPTHRANYEFRIWLIERLNKLYTITTVVVEDVKFNHYINLNGKSFSNVEIGKTMLYNYLNSKFKVELLSGFTTRELRTNFYGYDPKKPGMSNKGNMEFEAHCLDAFVLACNKTSPFDLETGEIFTDQLIPDFDRLKLNSRFVAIGKLDKMSHIGGVRCLFAAGKSFQNRSRRPAQLVKTLPGGRMVKKTNQLSNKFNKCRVKVDYRPSNHGPWIYKNNGQAIRSRGFPQIIKQKNYLGKKKVYKPHGGTVKNGVPKYFVNNEWVNRNVQVFKSH